MMTETEILTRVDRLTQDRLTLCITRAWVRPRLSEAGRVYDDIDVARLRLIVDLIEDMAVNDEAVPLILGLIDEISTLRRRVRVVDAAIGGVGVRDAVRARLAARDGSGA